MLTITETLNYMNRILRCVEIDPKTRCWEWKLSKDSFGYGYINAKDFSTDRAHRVSYMVFTGKIIQDEVLRHTCDNPGCVNPAHLLPGTHADNVADRVAKGRSALGTRNGRSKLSESDVLEILSLLDRGEPKKAIARRFGVDPALIRRIGLGLIWKHVTNGRKESA